MFKVIIAGSRGFNDYNLLSSKLDTLFMNVDYNTVEIVSGGARGADSMGERYAKENGMQTKIFLPDWSIGKQAGFIRNWEMAKYADACVVFMHEDGTKGSEHMINLAKKEKLNLRVIYYK